MPSIKVRYDISVRIYHHVSSNGHLGCNHTVPSSEGCHEGKCKWDLELFDIVAIELDFRANQALNFLRVHQFIRRSIIRQTKFGTDGYPIGNDKSDVIRLICSAYDYLGNEATHSNGFFNWCGTYVFSILELVQFFEPAGNEQKSISIKFAKVTCVESDFRAVE